MNDSSRVPLAQLLREAARELEGQPLPPLRPWQAAANEPLRRPAREPRRWRWPAAWSGAAACVGVVLVSALLMLQGLHGGAPQPAGTSPPQARASDFMAVASPERWTELGRDGPDAAWLVTTEMPRERLAALGLPYDPARAGENVRAELLLHPSGEVLAVRFLR